MFVSQKFFIKYSFILEDQMVPNRFGDFKVALKFRAACLHS